MPIVTRGTTPEPRRPSADTTPDASDPASAEGPSDAPTAPEAAAFGAAEAAPVSAEEPDTLPASEPIPQTAPTGDSDPTEASEAEAETLDAMKPVVVEPAPSDVATPSEADAAPDLDAALAQALDVVRRLQARLRAQVLGRDEVIDLVLVALLSDGHVLLEDYPGSGKTTLAKTLGLSIADDGVEGTSESEDGREAVGRSRVDIVPFRRIQFTPDLLPSDVTGVSVFDATTSLFHFRHGPLFAHVVLADEINRTSPKVQSAMLEAMAEKQVTVDNVTHTLDGLFFVIATQNPLDLAGTYPLPAPQLDRFLFKIRMDHIDRDAELRVLDTYRERRDIVRQDLARVGRGEVIAARRAIEDGVAIDPSIKACLVDLSRNLRADERVLQGNSTRSLVLFLPALQAMAAVRGRDYVSADDVRILAPRVLGHRVELAPGVSDFEEVLRDAMAEPLEGLARRTLRRRR